MRFWEVSSFLCLCGWYRSNPDHQAYAAPLPTVFSLAQERLFLRLSFRAAGETAQGTACPSVKRTCMEALSPVSCLTYGCITNHPNLPGLLIILWVSNLGGVIWVTTSDLSWSHSCVCSHSVSSGPGKSPVGLGSREHFKAD